MKSLSQNRINSKTSDKRTFAVVLLLCFITVSLLSGAFILTHADHEHDSNEAGGSCVACVQIQNAESVLRLFGTVAAFGCMLFAGYYTAIAVVRILYSIVTALTPITANIRMNN